MSLGPICILDKDAAEIVYFSLVSSFLVNPYKRDHWMFGTGRRTWPGIPFVSHEISPTLSGMLWTFGMRLLPVNQLI